MKKLSMICLPLLVLACKTTASGEKAKVLGAGSQSIVNCIHDTPLTVDGYSGFAIVSDDQVQRKIVQNGKIEEDPEKIVWPQDNQIQAAMKNISDYIHWMESTYPQGSANRRAEVYRPEGGYQQPYCLFHPQGRAVFGTVILFHGFNDRPDQQAKLASFLFHSGFNIYNVFLAQHFKTPGTDFWPRTTYKSDVMNVLLGKLKDPRNAGTLQDVGPRILSSSLTDADKVKIEKVLQPELSLSLFEKAWQNPSGVEFQKLYNQKNDRNVESQPSDFLDYLRTAEDRLNDIAPLPGPVFVTGLSVGATVAMALAESDGGKRIRAVAAQSPWLRDASAGKNFNLMFAAPLDKQVTLLGGEYPVAFENHKIPFSPASASANLALGGWVANGSHLKHSSAIPHAFFTTEIDDSADNGATWQVFQAMNSGPTNSLHYWHQYPRSYDVGHALADPENYRSDNIAAAQGGGWNRNWKTLYQEIYRFFTRGKVVHNQFLSKDLDQSIPSVPCVIRGQFSYRCHM